MLFYVYNLYKLRKESTESTRAADKQPYQACNEMMTKKLKLNFIKLNLNKVSEIIKERGEKKYKNSFIKVLLFFIVSLSILLALIRFASFV